MIPGEVISTKEPIEINAGCEVTQLTITNTSDVPIHVTAHFHVFEANPRLVFDRRKAYGMRLDAHAKGAVRFEPGSAQQVSLVPIGGKRIVHGFNGAVNGPLDEIDPDTALQKLIERGFLHREES